MAAPGRDARDVIAAQQRLAVRLTDAAKRNTAGLRILTATYHADIERAEAGFESDLGERPRTLPARLETRLVPETGLWIDDVWIPHSMLEDLADQEPFASDIGPAYIAPDRDQRRVLIAAGLAVEETRGGLHYGANLAVLLASLTGPGSDQTPP
jgi:hypothetical protein